MKAILQKVPVFTDSSFAVQEFRSAHFTAPWHFHPEFELVLVLQGTGKRFVGDHICDFSQGDLVLLGPNIPHWYRCDAAHYEPDAGLVAESVVVQFTAEFLGERFFGVPEALQVRKLLDKSVLGIAITGATRDRVAEMMQRIRQMSGMEKLLHLLQLLHQISIGAGDLYTLSNQGATGTHMRDSERINKIYEYVMQHFTQPISLDDISGILNMCPSTFCRYFRKHTRKNFTHFLNEIRIGHACKMLIEGDVSITEICFMSGYNNIAYFNRQFKAMKQMTPKAFKQAYNNR